MKITTQRKAISQSMDLFIIIAAVLGVGGIVSASIYNLVNSATSSSDIVVTGASLKAGSSSSASPTALSISIKNDGGSPIACTPATCQVVFAATNTGTAMPPACAAPCSITSGGPATWSVGGPAGIPAANNPLTFQTSAFTLQPGGEASFVLNGALSTLGTSPSFWATGASVTLNVVFGSASAQVGVVSQ
jgi:hypothetical protein